MVLPAVMSELCSVKPAVGGPENSTAVTYGALETAGGGEATAADADGDGAAGAAGFAAATGDADGEGTPDAATGEATGFAAGAAVGGTETGGLVGGVGAVELQPAMTSMAAIRTPDDGGTLQRRLMAASTTKADTEALYGSRLTDLNQAGAAQILRNQSNVSTIRAMAAPISAVNTIAEAGLERVSPFEPGIRRTRGPNAFEYADELGQSVADAEILARIKHLAIPPAWRDVWISSNPLGHIQATGFDTAGRKQYRYHPAWRDVRSREKFDEVATFGDSLPVVRTHVETDLTQDGLSHRRVLSCAVRLLELGSFRIGCDRYAVHDDTHGLTTMLAGDVHLDGEFIVFDYVGKEHKHQLQHVVDADVRGIIAELLAARKPDERLFAFRDASRWVTLHAGDVNHYLKEASGMSSSAKEFRTWNATVLAASVLAGLDRASTGRAMDRAFKSAATTVAQYLGNTPTIARSSYIDPRVFTHYRTGWAIAPEIAELGIGLEARPPATRRPVEMAVLDLIQQRWDSNHLRRLGGGPFA